MIASKTVFKKVLSIARQLFMYLAVFLVFSWGLDYWRGKALPIAAIPVSAYTGLDSTTYDINALSQSQLVVVYFWATWCGPCKVTTPSVKQLAKHYPVVTIAMASGSDATLNDYVHEAGLNVPVVNDQEQAIAGEWGVGVTPTVLFIKNGQILGYTMGASAYPGLLARAWWWARGN